MFPSWFLIFFASLFSLSTFYCPTQQAFSLKKKYIKLCIFISVAIYCSVPLLFSAPISTTCTLYFHNAIQPGTPDVSFSHLVLPPFHSFSYKVSSSLTSPTSVSHSHHPPHSNFIATLRPHYSPTLPFSLPLLFHLPLLSPSHPSPRNHYLLHLIFRIHTTFAAQFLRSLFRDFFLLFCWFHTLYFSAFVLYILCCLLFRLPVCVCVYLRSVDSLSLQFVFICLKHFIIGLHPDINPNASLWSFFFMLEFRPF